MDIINKYGFRKVDTNEFIRENWTLRIWYNEFELFSNPEIDNRYLKAPLDDLETALEELF